MMLSRIPCLEAVLSMLTDEHRLSEHGVKLGMRIEFEVAGPFCECPRFGSLRARDEGDLGAHSGSVPHLAESIQRKLRQHANCDRAGNVDVRSERTGDDHLVDIFHPQLVGIEQ